MIMAFSPFQIFVRTRCTLLSETAKLFRTFNIFQKERIGKSMTSWKLNTPNIFTNCSKLPLFLNETGSYRTDERH